MKFSYTVFIAVILFSGSCMSLRPGSTKSGKKYFETYYAGDAGSQYFVKPVYFQGADGANEITLDFSFRYRDRVKDSAIVNISIYHSEIKRKLDSYEIRSGGSVTGVDGVELMFNEKQRDLFHSRFTSLVPLTDVVHLFESADWSVSLHYPDGKEVYVADRKTADILTTLNENLFILMR